MAIKKEVKAAAKKAPAPKVAPKVAPKAASDCDCDCLKAELNAVRAQVASLQSRLAAVIANLPIAPSVKRSL